MSDNEYREYRIRLPVAQAKYLEQAYGDEFPGDSEKFRALVHDHRVFRQLLDLGLDFDYDEFGDEPDK